MGSEIFDFASPVIDFGEIDKDGSWHHYFNCTLELFYFTGFAKMLFSRLVDVRCSRQDAHGLAQ